MQTSTATGLSIERSLELAHHCINWVLQFGNFTKLREILQREIGVSLEALL